MTRRSGFTLLEVLLALVISGFVLFTLGMAIDLHFRSLEAGRTEVEEAQLARAILRRIADDVRSTIRYAPMDVNSMMPLNVPTTSKSGSGGSSSGGSGSGGSSQGSSGSTGGSSNSGSSNSSSSKSSSGVTTATNVQSVTNVSDIKSTSSNTSSNKSSGSTSGNSSSSSSNKSSSGSSSSGNSSSSGASGSNSGGSSGTGSQSSSSGGQTTANTELAASTVVPVTPGLYGNRYEMQVDVSRLPRVDQYEQLAMLPDGAPADRVSDVKTVAYYVANTMAMSAQGGSSVGGGLMRREVDRAVTAWANTQGMSPALDQHQELVAPEVLSVEFEYFDGTEWVEYWDAAERKGTPIAVRVALMLTPTQNNGMVYQWLGFGGLAETAAPRIYRMSIHLPTSQPTTLETTSTTETDSSTSGTSSGTSGSASGSSSTSGT